MNKRWNKSVLCTVQNDLKIQKKIKENLLSNAKCLFALIKRTMGLLDSLHIWVNFYPGLPWKWLALLGKVVFVFWLHTQTHPIQGLQLK